MRFRVLLHDLFQDLLDHLLSSLGRVLDPFGRYPLVEAPWAEEIPKLESGAAARTRGVRGFVLCYPRRANPNRGGRGIPDVSPLPVIL